MKVIVSARMLAVLVSGAARGAAATRQERQLVIKNCLRHRIYSVLN